MKYQDGKIYKILNSENDDVYIGSTCQKLSKRMTNHRTQAKSGKTYLLYQKMREIGDDKFYIELVENYPCENLEQLNKREGEWIREIATLNDKVAGRTKQEYAKDNRDIKNQKAKEDYQANKEQILRRHREHYRDNQERINERHKKYNEEHKEEIKRYRDARKQEKTEYNKSYYKENKEQSYQKHKEWVLQNKIKIICEICKREYPKYDKAHHIQRKYHLDALNNLNNSNNVQLQSDNLSTNGEETEREEVQAKQL